jgi:hypothetical protein
MELNIKNPSSRVLVEKADNGVILYEIGEDNTVSSRLVYEIYFKDGMLDFEALGNLVNDIFETVKVPTEEVETNRRLGVHISKIDPDKPSLGEPEKNDDNEE